MESPEELAIRYFNSGYNCAESVLKAVAETFGARGQSATSCDPFWRGRGKAGIHLRMPFRRIHSGGASCGEDLSGRSGWQRASVCGSHAIV